MVATLLQPETGREPNRTSQSSTAIVLVAIALGLCAGYLDLLVMVFMKYCWNERFYYWNASDFPWTVPTAHALLLGVAALLVVTVNQFSRTRPVTLRASAWLFATLALWFALLRAPMYGLCTLLLAAGLGRPIAAAVVAIYRNPRQARYVFSALIGALILLASLSSGVRSIQKQRALAALPAAAKGARNVIMIVWDTVRAPSMSLYGYDRDNTPYLKKWAEKGVRHTLAIAPATWTYPSHSSMFTGLWPYQINTQWNSYLDTPAPTLAEFLASRGYQTAGFVANTRCCSYETGLDRGFIDYEDYPLTPQSLLSRTIPGSWVLMNLLSFGDFYGAKWINIQSRDASGINDAFLDWLEGRNRERPFFAFLNYYDAHNPYVPPPKYTGRFGTVPRYPEDYQLLHDFTMEANDPNWNRNVNLARECYDDCIAAIDDEFGRLMNTLRRRGVLENTLVIITGDHGESFGDHYLFSHGTGLYIDQIAVPLVFLSPDAPAGLSVTTPVSLRDLPATVVDQLGLSAGSPFPGYSLASFWSPIREKETPTVSRAFTELVGSIHESERLNRPTRRGLQMSIMTPGWHYVRPDTGPEQFFEMPHDMGELNNVATSAASAQHLNSSRRTLLRELTANPGSPAVESAYLKPYRQALESVVESSAPAVAPIRATGSP